jgi:hypothetical protein
MRHAPITYNIPIFNFYISLMQVNFKLTNEIVACKRLAVEKEIVPRILEFSRNFYIQQAWNRTF